MFTVEVALKVGLIDETATEEGDAVVKCKKFIEKFDNVPQLARSVTKLRMRQTVINRLQDSRQADAGGLLEMTLNPKAQENLEKFLQK